MGNVGLLWLTIIVLLVAVLISVFFNVNVGICCYAMAFIVGTFGVGLTVNEIVAFFPVSLFFQIMIATLFYGYAINNGTLTVLANKLIYACRNKPSLLPFVLGIISFVLAAIGCPPPATSAPLQAISLDVEKKAGFKYLIANEAVSLLGMAGAFMPLGLFNMVLTSFLAAFGMEGAAMAATLRMTRIVITIFFVVLMVGLFIAQKAYRAEKLEMEKPEPLNKDQKKVLVIIGVMLALVLVPAVLKPWLPVLKPFASNVTIITTSAIGALICAALRLGNERQIIRNCIPWPLLITISGAVAMISVINATGLTEMISSFLSGNMSAFLVPVLFCLLAAVMSFFVDATGVVLPLFIPTALGVSAASGINAAMLVACVVLGAYIAGFCPLSTCGAQIMMYCPEDQIKKNFYQVWLFAIIGVVVAVIFSVVLSLIF